MSNLQVRDKIPTQENQKMQSLRTVAGLVVPVLIIGSLLYVGLFVERQVEVQHWERPAIESRDIIYSVVQPETSMAWGAGNLGKIVRSQDGGETWKVQNTNVSANFQKMAAWDTDKAVAVGNNGVIAITDDGGETWSSGSISGEFNKTKLLNVTTLSDGQAWAIGERGVMLHSSDFGRTWDAVGTDEDIGWNGISFYGNTGIIVGEFGEIKISGDSGKTWARIDNPGNRSLYAVQLRSPDVAVAVGSQGTIMHTNDAGATWHEQSMPIESHLFDVHWDGSRWLAVGDNGALLATTSSDNDWADLTGVAGSNWRTEIRGVNGHYLLAGRGIQEVKIPSANAANKITKVKVGDQK